MSKKKKCVVEINSSSVGSTGTIMFNIAKLAREDGLIAFSAFPSSRTNLSIKCNNSIIIGSRISRNFHILLARLTGLNGIFSFFSTKNFLSRIDKLKPNVIHLHNLHGNYINLPLLFRYIKKHNVKVVWTLHDCWAFTGHCPHFTMSKCDKWKIGCYKCDRYREYPASLFDNSKKMYKLKKKWFTGVKDLTIVTPSEWLSNLVKQSFLGEYDVRVINNGIDLSVFKPTASDFRKKHGISEDKFVLLGVAFDWGKRKGLDVFTELSKRLDEKKYQIVLVGTNEEIDRGLPSNIVSIHRTQNQTELAEIYTAVDLFVNPTREEVLGMVNIEANACGTPVLTFKTGGSPECIDEKSGSVVECDDIDRMESEIMRICETAPFSKENCIEQSRKFDMNDCFKKYIDLYHEIDGE